MKQIISLLAILIMVLAITASTSGAIHSSYRSTSTWYEYPWDVGGYYSWNSGGGFPIVRTDTWFSIVEEKTSVLYGTVRSKDSDGIFGAGFLLDDFTFAEISAADESFYDYDLKGSYLFNNGIFIGLDYISAASGSTTYLSPGYRFGIGGYDSASYIALSLDYYWADGGDSDQSDFEADLKYYGDKTKIIGQAILDTRDATIDGTLYTLLVNYEVCTDVFVIGGRVTDFMDMFWYQLGATWTCNRWIVDFMYANYFVNIFNELPDETEHFYVLSGMYDVTDKLALGGEYLKFIDIDEWYYLAVKAKYAWDAYILTGYYRLESDVYNSQFMIGIEKQF
jgi:hypothetical protein